MTASTAAATAEAPANSPFHHETVTWVKSTGPTACSASGLTRPLPASRFPLRANS